ncbi:MAG: aldo/keto reductase [Methanobrevibacter sp.]|uniref:aldo/keto reductase n=1 Tax=Methanobrevibacter sp. TaxID=66852 RepID=UPI0026001E2F|nr:aldo/keto reductase [Methanobrevibacter sp.]MBE6508380.1 aldo/keto reductase [Methanobrevibacter sp.]
MEYTKLGNSSLKVSRVCMGCMGFGDPENGMHTWTLPESESMEIIKKGLDSGINFYDTAIGYQNGTSEQYLGKTIKEYAARDEVVVATKFLPRSEEEIKNNVPGQMHIHNFVEKSLENLGLDYIDLYIYHMWDYNTPLYDILEGLSEVIDEGKVKYIGISNCFAWQLAKANALAEMQGFKKFVSIQGHYNLIFREEEREMIPLCKTDNIAVTPYSALASGRLSRMPGEESKRLNEDFYAKLKYQNTEAQDLEIIKRVNELAGNYDVSMTEVSLAWLLTKVTSPIVGATKMHHVEGAANAIDLKLTNDDIGYLEEPYVAHDLVGVMADNKATANDDDKVWAKHAKI